MKNYRKWKKMRFKKNLNLFLGVKDWFLLERNYIIHKGELIWEMSIKMKSKLGLKLFLEETTVKLCDGNEWIIKLTKLKIA